MYKRSFLLINLIALSFFIHPTAQEGKNDTVVEVIDKDFEAIVLNAELPVIVDFNAEWCGPCKNMKPVFEFLAEKYGKQYKFVSVNIDHAPKTSQKYGIQQIPTFAVFNNGKLHGTIVGILQTNTFADEIQKILKADLEKGPISNVPQIPAEMLLMQAVSIQDSEQLKQLIAKKINLDHVFKVTIPMGKDMGKEFEYTALSLALTIGNKEIVAILLNAGASIDLTFKHTDGSLVTAKQGLEKTKQEFINTANDMIAYLDNYKKNHVKI